MILLSVVLSDSDANQRSLRNQKINHRLPSIVIFTRELLL